MTKITAFTTQNAKPVQVEAEQALAQVAAKYGLTVRQHGGSVDGTKAVLKFEFKVTDPKAVEEDAREKWNLYCGMFGLKPEDFGRTFRSGQGTWAICGIEPRRTSYPIRAKREGDGKVMLFTKNVAAQIDPKRVFDN